MVNRFFRTGFRAIAASLVLGAVVGCATVAPATPEASVNSRANERWAHLVKGDIDAAYKLMSPAYRAVTTVNAFRATFGSAVQWKAAESTKVTCEADKCIALIKIEAKPIAGRSNLPLITYFEETWIREGSQWWFFPT
jgi:hypothetical protein